MRHRDMQYRRLEEDLEIDEGEDNMAWLSGGDIFSNQKVKSEFWGTCLG